MLALWPHRPGPLMTPRVPGPRGDDIPICTETIQGHYCGKRHITAKGTQACGGHVVFDRETYVPGQDRKPLDEPKPCRNSPVTGATVCHKHGVSGQVRAAGKQRETERKAAIEMRRFGEPVDTTPSEALLDTVKWTAGYVAWLREKVADITSDERLVWGQTRRKLGGHDTGTTHEAKPSPWLSLLGEWSDRLVKVCEAAIRAGIEERRVRIAEQQGALVADVIRKILGDLELTPEQASKAGEAVPRHLRLLAS